MAAKDDDAEAALNGILSKELIDKIKSFKRNMVGEITPEAFNELASIIEGIANEKSEGRNILKEILGIDPVDTLVNLLRNPTSDNANAEYGSMIKSKEIKRLLKSNLPKEVAGRLIGSESPFDFFMNFTEIGRSAFKWVTEEYYEFTDNCKRAVDELLNDLFSDLSRLKTRVNYVKKIENLRDVLSLLSSYNEIQTELTKLGKWKENVNLNYIKETILPIYLDLAAKYEMVSKFVLIDIDISEGQFDPSLKYMEFSLGQIVARISASHKFSILSDVDTIIRNSLAHGGRYYPIESRNVIRFFDKNRHEDLSYREIIDKTCRLASLFYVVLGYLEEGHKKEFQVVRNIPLKKEDRPD